MSGFVLVYVVSGGREGGQNTQDFILAILRVHYTDLKNYIF